MKSFKLSIASLVVFTTMQLLTINSVMASEAEHSHEHQSENSKSQQSSPEVTLASMQLNQGHKWAIDTSLHIGMTRIKTSMENNITAIHNKTFQAKQYSVLATELQRHLSYLFSHCKLPKAADEQLHTLLFSIMAGKAQMSDPGNERTGAIKVIKSLQQYPQFFDDKKWQDLQH